MKQREVSQRKEREERCNLNSEDEQKKITDEKYRKLRGVSSKRGERLVRSGKVEIMKVNHERR